MRLASQLCSTFPNVPFEIIAPVYMRLGHEEDATSQARMHARLCFAPKLTVFAIRSSSASHSCRICSLRT